MTKYIKYVTPEISEMMKQLGWDLYTVTQFGKNNEVTRLSLEMCALSELINKPVLYRPTIEETLCWILDRFNLFLSVVPRHGTFECDLYDTEDDSYTLLKCYSSNAKTPQEMLLIVIADILEELLEDH